jgi:methionine-rich copper-binding protein CopC
MFKHFFVFLLLMLMLPISASAHSPLASLSPEDGASLDQTPPQIEMVFKSPAKLIKVEMLKLNANSNGSLLGSLFGGSEGDEVSLGKDFLMKVAETHAIALPQLTIGNYAVAWRAMGEDGHVIKGDFSFKVTGN